ncbi:extracellular solute-binding protein [Azospirillum sp. ST 5-10]|uniref:extracellular solute-binding protein n=1 Tax=unclassified Azospirillum TaxID=2630922 RepID=UPI003F49F2E8
MLRTIAALILALAAATGAHASEPRHALALYGEPKYGPEFRHFGYVNPDAPKGGAVALSAVGSFDTLNPYTLKGVPAAGLGSMYDTLMASSDDETFTQYGLLAETVEVADDLSWVRFVLRPQARWHDGRPVTAADVAFSFDVLTTNHPFYKGYYAGVRAVEVEGERAVRFLFNPGDNRELPLILGQLPVLPRHYWQGRDFAKSTLEPPLGSGPYRIARVDPGRSIVYERVTDYWGRDLPVNAGRHNFGSIAYEYYRDTAVALQAFRSGLVDFRAENAAKTWATGYDVAEIADGRIVKEEIPHRNPAGMQGYVFNTRRPIFQDPRVRYAIAHAFDFEWTNATLLYGAYTRTDSYFDNSDLQSRGVPDTPQLALLEPLRGQVPDEVFLRPYEPPSTDGPNGLRRNLLTAQRLLEDAGWEIRDGVRVNAGTGRALEFEILLDSPTFERITLPFVANLRRLGIRATVRTVDAAQYQNRVRDFDFDMVVHVWPQSLSPGNEQRGFWGAAAADSPGSENLAGVRSPAVDRLIDAIVQATTRKGLESAVAALDRVLLWSHYVVPHWHSGVYRVAYWRRLHRPDVLPPYALAFDAWWVDAADRSVAEQPAR